MIFHYTLFCNFSYLVHVLSQLKKKKKEFYSFLKANPETVEAKVHGCYSYATCSPTWLDHPATHVQYPVQLTWRPFIYVQYSFLKYIFELEHTLLLYISQQWQLSKLFSLDASHVAQYPAWCKLTMNSVFTSANHSGKITYLQPDMQQPLKIPRTIGFWVEFVDCVFGFVFLPTR